MMQGLCIVMEGGRWEAALEVTASCVHLSVTFQHDKSTALRIHTLAQKT